MPTPAPVPDPVQEPVLLAVDAGGTSTRAVLHDTAGRVFGHGRAGGGNPTAGGIPQAVESITEAASRAASRADQASAKAGRRGTTATIAMAGEQSTEFADRVSERLAALGWREVVLQHDLLGVFGSGTYRSDGYAVIAGTGSVAARVLHGRLDRVVGGRGWLLGDAGSGFWIGHRTVRAVIADLDGQQSGTALTPLVLAALGVPAETDSPAGRTRTLRRLMSVCYAQQPVQLAALAPLAFTVHDDPTARAILMAASEALADLVRAVRLPGLAGPVVAGGSVLVQGLLATSAGLDRAWSAIAADSELIPVADGVVGAVFLGLRRAGVDVDEALFETVRAEVARVAR